MRYRTQGNRNMLLVAFVAFATLATGFLLGRIVGSPGGAPGGASTGAPAEDMHGSEEHALPEEITLSARALATGGIRTLPAVRADVGASITAPATVEISPNRAARITPPAAGKVTRLLFDRGDSVRGGDIVAMLESSEVAQARANVRDSQSSVEKARERLAAAQQALTRQKQLAAAGAFSQAPLQAAQSEVNEAQSALLQAQAEHQTHTVAMQRAERLFNEELISRTEMDEAQLEHKRDEAQVERAKQRVALATQALEREKKLFTQDLFAKQAVQTAEAEVRAARADLDSELGRLASARSTLSALVGSTDSRGGGTLAIRSPISGVVVDRLATLGEAVERTSPLFTVENRQSVLVVAQVPERDAGTVRVGQTVEVSAAAYPERDFRGIVQSLAGRVDTKTRTLPVRCLVANSDGLLRPEMFAEATIVTGAVSQAVVVSASAVKQSPGGSYVYVRRGKSFTRVPVVTGRTSGRSVEIVRGLAEGDPVVTEGVFVLEGERASDTLKGHDH